MTEQQPPTEDEHLQTTATAQTVGQGFNESLADHLGELARTLQHASDTDKMLAEVVAAAVALIPGTDEGSISVVVGRREVISQSPSSKLPARVDAVQTEVQQGPCLDAVYQHQTVRVDDMASEDRWPLFARRALEEGAASMLSLQLYVAGDNLGALNLYGRRPHAFSDESEQVGLIFATHAAVAFADAQKIDQLGVKVATRDLIGQAKGILMERYAITGDQAFAVLARVSQQRNLKLRDVAVELTQTRQLNQQGPDF